MSDAPRDPRVQALLDTLRRSFDGSAPAEPRDGDWLEGAAGQDAARASLAAARDLLLAAVATFPPGQLDHPLPRPRSRA